jgi:outer membrane protein, heavy metal efflux system
VLARDSGLQIERVHALLRFSYAPTVVVLTNRSPAGSKPCMDSQRDVLELEDDMALKCLVPLGIVVALGLTGCAPTGVESVRPAFRPLEQDVSLYQPPLRPFSAPPITAPPETPTDVLTLRQALALALVQNPELSAFSWEVRAAEARTLQAGLRPNPELGLEVENVAGTGALRGRRSAETTLRLSQVIELGGKRTMRLRVAALERDLATWDYETKRVEVLTAVAQAFVEVLRAQERLETEKDLVQLAAQVLATVAERVSAGKVSPVEETKAGVALSTSRVALERARRELVATKQRLVATWGSSTPTFQKVEGAFETVATPPSAEALAERILDNPDVARWGTELQQRQAAVDLAEAQKVPDLTAGGGVRYLNEAAAAALVFAFSVPLPVVNRNQGVILEAHHRLAKAGEERRAAVVRVRAALATAYATLTAAFAEATTLREESIPGARRVFEATSEGYRQGKFSLLDVLDAQRTLFEAKEQYIEALATYHKAVAEAERLLGGELTTVMGLAGPHSHGAPR